MSFAVPAVVSAGRMHGGDQPVLRTGDGGLSLRPWRPGDVDALVAAHADPLIRLWHRRDRMSRRQALALIASWNRRWRDETDAYWAVVHAGTGEVLGRVSLREVRLSEGVAECSYWVLAAARGRGIATRAVSELCRWSFGELGLHRLELAHSVANTPSCRVAGKTGFRLEGTKRSALLHGDGWHDMHLHARVADGDGNGG